MIDEASEYCKMHDPIAQYNVRPNYTIYIHGTVYEIENQIFISEVFGNIHKYSKVRLKKVRGKDRYYFTLPDKPDRKFYLDEFTKPS